MPLWDFACGVCDHRYEAFTGIVDDPGAKVCPKCGATSVAKVYTLPTGGVAIVMDDVKNMDADTVAQHLESRDIAEKAIASGAALDIKERGPREFRIRTERRFY